MSGENMEQRIDVGEIPTGGVVPTEDQMASIDRYVEGGHMSHAEATMKVLGVMPGRVYEDPRTEEPPAPQEPTYDDKAKVANLIHMYKIRSGIGPKISELHTLKGDAWGNKATEIKRDKSKGDIYIKRACATCTRQNDCDEKGKTFEQGIGAIHPRLKPSEKYPHANIGESLLEMIQRQTKNPDAHCNPAKDEIALDLDEISPVIEITAGEAVVVSTEDEGDRTTANLELRNAHLAKADKALSKRNSLNRQAKMSVPEKSGRLAEESNDFFEIFSDELKQGCSSCSDRGVCPLALDPVAWDEAKHYSRSPSTEWEDTVDDNGVKHESREQWRRRREQDPNASCVPPVADSENIPKVA